MLTESELRHRLAGAASAAPTDVDVSAGALALGRRRVTRRHRATALTSSAAFVSVATVAATVLFSAGSTGNRAEAAVTCAANSTRVTSATVSAQATGATLSVTNTTGRAVQLLADGQGAFVPPGRTTIVLALPPGRHQISCAGTGGVAAASLDVVDDGHIYTPAALPCAHPVLHDFSPESRIDQGDPRALTAALLHRRAGDEIVVLGYPSATARTVALKRNGAVEETATWHELVSDQLWTLGVVETCKTG